MRRTWTGICFGRHLVQLAVLLVLLLQQQQLWLHYGKQNIVKKKIIKLAFSDNFQLYNPNTGESVKFIGISVTNTGNRKVIIRTWGVHLKEGSAIVMPPVDANGIEKMVYTKLPQTLDLEESIDLQWQKDKFQLFLEANEDNIEKSKPLVFYVNDSTGKQYTVKTKENASCYFKE